MNSGKSPPEFVLLRAFGPSSSAIYLRYYGSLGMALVRPSLWVALVLLLLAGAWRTSTAAPPPVVVPPSLGTVKNLDLKMQLEKGLKARRPVEFAYVAQVITMVENGTLPRSLVDSTFGYARKQPRPLQYFEFALQLRAKKAGIDVTPIEKIVSPQR
jgi:hypothetical protein